ncbi:MAG TPA: DUF6152 family protein [Candidatus Acidoferrales bacterium]|nr:DUF6152 family protein [Candidatus Acidoferrales bacterium]
MKQKAASLLVSLFALLLLVVPAFAHHGTAGDDTSKLVTVKGTVTDFQYINPHVQIYVETKDEQGNVEKWNGEASNALALHRAGWNSKVIKPGDQITMTGYQAKTGAKMLRLKSVTLSDGRELETFPRE